MSLKSLMKITNRPLPPQPGPSLPTLLAVQALEAQGAVTLVALLPGPAAAPVGTGARHARVGCVVHVHAPGEVVPHVDGVVIQGDLGEKVDLQGLRKHSAVCKGFLGH